MMERAGEERCALVDRALPGAGARAWWDAVLVIAGAALVALFARVEIPLVPVPITGQTLAVLWVAALLGARRGAWAMMTYLAAGAMGFPIFAGGGAGPATLLGPTAGYLVGFLLAAYVVGTLCEVGWDRRVGSALLAMAAGTALITACGVLWLAPFVGWDRVFVVGVRPFLIGDALKIGLAMLLLPLGRRLVGSPTRLGPW